jgi:hypothetical protein
MICHDFQCPLSADFVAEVADERGAVLPTLVSEGGIAP